MRCGGERPSEVVVVVRRGRDFLALRRVPERLGYWNLVAGGVEPGESPAAAARRELAEETGLDSDVAELPVALSYSLLDDPPEVRARYAPGIETITVHAFVTEAPPQVGAPSRLRARRLPVVRRGAGAGAPPVRDAPRSGASGRTRGSLVRVGIDVSPLVQTRAGTARHVRGLVGALRGRPGLELDLLTFGRTSRASSVIRDAVWYPVGLRRRGRSLDLLHCTTFRGPAGGRVPLVVTVHDLAILRYPEAFPRWHRLYGSAGLRRVLESADAVVAVSEFTKAEILALTDVSADRVRVIPNGVDDVFTRRGTVRGTGIRARGRDARAPEEPRASSGSRAPGRGRAEGGRRARLGRRGRPGLGRRDSRRRAGGALPGSPLRPLPVAVRGLRAPGARGDGLRSSCGHLARDRHGGDRGRRRRPRRPVDSMSIANGIAEAAARRDELVPLGVARAREFTWGRAADAVESLWRELA